MSNHDYTGCQDSACGLCAAYGTGYAAGKDKGVFECALATIHMSTTPECRCSSCVGLRYAIFSLSEGTPAPPPPPTPKHGRCAVCEREGMVIEVVCSRCWG